jgi:SAM-dependent methyltransferase
MHDSTCVACGSADGVCVLADAEDYEYRVPGRFRFVRCERCSLVYMNPRPSSSELVDYYPSDYHSFQRPENALFVWLSRLSYRLRLRDYRKRLGERGRILDVGCGDGALLHAFHEQGYRDLHGLDFHPAASEHASEFEYFAGTIEAAPYPDASFDLIVMHHLLEHVEQPLQTLARAHALLAPGGTLVGQLPNIDSVEYRIFGRYWNGFHAPRHLQCFSAETLCGALQRAGFASFGWTPAPHPGQWALSLQSYIVGRWLPRAQLRHGKTRFYPACLVLALPLLAIDVLSKKSGVINFWARR